MSRQRSKCRSCLCITYFVHHCQHDADAMITFADMQDDDEDND